MALGMCSFIIRRNPREKVGECSGAIEFSQIPQLGGSIAESIMNSIGIKNRARTHSLQAAHRSMVVRRVSRWNPFREIALLCCTKIRIIAEQIKANKKLA
jgi:hypothetical protein